MRSNMRIGIGFWRNFIENSSVGRLPIRRGVELETCDLVALINSYDSRRIYSTMVIGLWLVVWGGGIPGALATPVK